jgi:hypothetical protein
MRHHSATSARRAVSALLVGNGFAFGVWSAHISVFKQNYGFSNEQLTIPLFTLALGAIVSMPIVGRQFHRIDWAARGGVYLGPYRAASRPDTDRRRGSYHLARRPDGDGRNSVNSSSIH